MSKIKPRSADTKQILDGFAGLGDTGALGKNAATEMRNFRLLGDGTLEKRCGWNRFATLNGEIRGVWQGALNATPLLLIAAGNTVYRMDQTTPIQVGSLGSNTGHVSFVPYRNHLYLLDGDAIYVLSNPAGSFREAHGYAPLYGRNWHPTNGGDVNEPLNVFSKRIRVHYYNTTGSTAFVLPYFAGAIDSVRVDNLTVTNFDFLSGSDTVTVPRVGTYVEIAFTMAYASALRTEVHSCSHALCERVGEREVMLLYGGDAGERLFCSAKVDDNALNYCKVAYADADPLYCKANGALNVGDSQHPITLICRERNRFLAFHAGGAYSILLSDETDTPQGYPLLRGVGCTAPIDVSLTGNPVIVNEGGIFRLSSPASDPDAFVLSSLADGMEKMLTPSFLANAVATSDPSHGELWFRDPTDKSGIVWIYNTARKEWYTFGGMSASFFLKLNGNLGFASERSIFLFDESCLLDNGKPFEAVWQSSFCSLSSPEEYKRSMRLSLVSANSESTELRLTTPKKEAVLFLPDSDNQAPTVIDQRVALGRFRLLQLRLCDSGEKRSRYYRLSVYAKL